MKDDYLWDGTGEPDPDIQRLEQTLGRFRYQAQPLNRAFDQRLFPRPARLWPRFVAAAAVVLMALVGVWVFTNRQRPDAQQQVAVAPAPTKQPESNPLKDEPKEIAQQPKRSTAVTAAARASAVRKARRTAPSVTTEIAKKDASTNEIEPESFDPNISEMAVVQPIVIPFVDLETSRHIERSQMLLRSFRNLDEGAARDDSQIAYEKRQSRGLLYQNIVLRRDAEAKGNLPVEDLLGSLEPFLIDIANLPDKPSKDDLLAVKERMQKKEIVSALQIYSAPTLGQVFK